MAAFDTMKMRLMASQFVALQLCRNPNLLIQCIKEFDTKDCRTTLLRVQFPRHQSELLADGYCEDTPVIDVAGLRRLHSVHA